MRARPDHAEHDHADEREAEQPAGDERRPVRPGARRHEHQDHGDDRDRAQCDADGEREALSDRLAHQPANTVFQSSLTLTTVQPSALRPLEGILCAGHVIELALRVVVQHEQPETRLATTRELEHRDVTIRVAAGEVRPPADAAPDSDRLHGAVVEDVRFRLVDDRAALFVLLVAERVRTPDHALRRDLVDLGGDGPHEVAVASRGDVGREPVRLQVAQQLDHRQVAAVTQLAAERRVLRVGEERGRARLILVDRPAAECLQDASHQQLHVAVVAVVVLRDRAAEPGVVVLVGRLPRLTLTERGVRLRHLGQPLQDERELDRQRLLAPQRAVVVEDRNPLLGRNRLRGPLDEVGDRLPRSGVVPRRERPGHRASHAPWPRRDAVRHRCTRRPPRRRRP